MRQLTIEEFLEFLSQENDTHSTNMDIPATLSAILRASMTSGNYDRALQCISLALTHDLDLPVPTDAK